MKYLLFWNQVDALQKHFKKDHVHMRLWTRLYGIFYCPFQNTTFQPKFVLFLTPFLFPTTVWLTEDMKIQDSFTQKFILLLSLEYIQKYTTHKK